ncbi:MAG: amino acid adenylation domain-containing protein [Halanaerobiales bacterium]|nr:amino acid adenylation domain-containing protein [Halanaerobiales bacterium]
MSIIDRENIADMLALTSMQEGMLFYYLKEPESDQYFEQLSIRVAGPVQLNLFQQAWNNVVDSHEMLRTVFRWDKVKQPVQIVLKKHEPLVTFFDLTSTFGYEQETLLQEIKIADKKKRFDLQEVPFRISLCKIEDELFEIIISNHHILYDGWSNGIILKDFYDTYIAFANNKDFSLLSRTKFKEFIKFVQGRDKTSEESYWKAMFRDFKTHTILPITSRDNTGDKIIERYRLKFSESLNQEIQTFVSEQKITLATLFYTVWALVLHQYTSNQEVVFGTTVSGRNVKLKDVEKIVGLFINTLPLRVSFHTNNQISELLQQINELIQERVEYETSSLVDIKRYSGITGSSELFDSVMVIENYPLDKALKGNNNILVIQSYHLDERTNYDLTLVVETFDELILDVVFNKDKYKPEAIEGIARHFEGILQFILRYPDQQIDTIEMLTAKEKKQLLDEFNDTHAEYPVDQTVHTIFEAITEKYPNHVAVDFSEEQLTYLELNTRANQVARTLRDKGVQSEFIIGIMVENSLEMFVGIMAILKAGGAYLPIDPELPEERIRFMLEDSETDILLTTRKIQVDYTDLELEVIKLDDPASYHLNGSNLLNINTANDLVYIIYTSGTTGNPKGVMLEHKNVVRLLINEKAPMKFDETDVWVMFHSFSFDFSVWEMFGALLYGGKLIVIPKMVAREPEKFLNLLETEQVTILNQTPSAFYNLIDEDSRHPVRKLSIKYVIFGGEALRFTHLRPWKERYQETKLINMYGITETTVHVTFKDITDSDLAMNITNIGKPLPTVTTYIMDSKQRLLLIGVPGEIYVGGDGVARGYLNRPELTAERFIDNPYKPGEKLYKSGDLARLLENGEMEYLGRTDNQVKIKGFRIELGEIENLLQTHENIQQAVVLVNEDSNGEKYLCAYIVSDKNLTVSELREYLTIRLPQYMVPSNFVQIDEIPLTSNGKANRKALLKIQGNLDLGIEYVAPTNEVEEKLVQIWETILNSKNIGINHNYFDVGGDSIKAIRVISMINNQLDTDIKIADLYQNQTIAELAKVILNSVTKDLQREKISILQQMEELKNRIFATNKLTDEIVDLYPLADIEKGMIFLYLKNVDTAVYHDQFVTGWYKTNFDFAILKQAFNLMVKKHSILRTGFNMEDFEEPVQIVYRKVPEDIQFEDLSYLTKTEQETYITNFLVQDRQHPFTLEDKYFWRMRVFALNDENICLVWIVHHAILDGWSNSLLMTELHNIYTALESQQSVVLQPLKATYKDAIVEELLQKQDSKGYEYWKNELMDYKRLDFSGMYKNPTGSGLMKKYIKDMGESFLDKLQTQARKYNTTVKNLCFAAYVYMLSMISYENDLVMGIVTNTRPESEDGDKILGCFLNTVPVRLKVEDTLNWIDFVKKVDKKLLEVKIFDRIPLFEIGKIIGEKNIDCNPIFDTIFNFMDFHIVKEMYQGGSGFWGDDYAITGSENTNTIFDFEVNITNGTLVLCPKYVTTVFKDEDIDKLCKYYIRVLNKFIYEPESSMVKNAILLDVEKQRLLFEFNDTKLDYARDKTIYQLFEEQVTKTPDNIAVQQGNQCLTYRELNQRANQLAHELCKHGVQPGTFTGIIIDRCVEMVVGLLGISKAGGSYLPLEPGLPENRILKILDSLQVNCLVTDNSTLPLIGQISQNTCLVKHIFCINSTSDQIQVEEALFKNKNLIFADQLQHNSTENLLKISTSEDIAYVIFTSGSTGTPKGVVVKHRLVINVIEWVNRTFGVNSSDKILFLTSLSFDLSVYDVFGILATGGCIRIASKAEMKEPNHLLEIIFNEGITFWDSAPAALQRLVPFFPNVQHLADQSKLRRVFLSGDWISVPMPDLLRKAFPGVEVISLGGATEATIWSNYYPIGKIEPTWPSIPYGKPIQNAKYYILDHKLNLCPIGVAGDLYIGGECLAEGYINDPTLTAAKFIDSPYCPGEKLYKTGDIARWFEDGNMEFLGRRDHQVKIRGFRIELGEIESHLLEHDAIQEALVVARTEKNSSTKFLCAYYISSRQLDSQEIKDYLIQELPEYMVPAYFVQLDKLPISINGKIDRKALPEPEVGASSNTEFVPPSGQVEEKLAEIWRDILAPAIKIGRHDNFFDLGGHSLNATTIVARIHKELNVKVPLVEIFKQQTIQKLATFISNIKKTIYKSIKKVEERSSYPLSSAQKRMYIVSLLDDLNINYNIPSVTILEGQVDRARLENAFTQLINRHEGLRTYFVLEDGKPVQKIKSQIDFKINYFESNSANVDEEVKAFISPFDLSRASLFNVGLMKVTVEKYILIVDMHHIIADGISIGILIEEFAKLYAGQVLPGLNIQYKDYTIWQQEMLANPEIREQEKYWLNTLSGSIPVLQMPTDFPRPEKQLFTGNSVKRLVDNDLRNQINQFAKEANATQYMVLLAAYTILLYKYTGQTEIIIGSPVAGRSHIDLKHVVGMFVNTLAMKNQPQGKKIFSEFLQEVRINSLNAFKNQDYPLEELIEQLDIKRDLSRNSLFDTIFVLQNTNTKTLELNDCTIYPYELEDTVAKYDLILNISEDEDGLNVVLTYAIHLFSESTAEEIINNYVEVLRQVVENRAIVLDDVQISQDVLEVQSNTLDDIDFVF